MDCDHNYLNNDVFPKDKKNSKPEEKTSGKNGENNDLETNYTKKSDQSVPDVKGDRCQVCNKKLRTCVLECKCKQVFCSTHISNTAHNCSFDYKAFGKELLQKQNPKISFSKI